MARGRASLSLNNICPVHPSPWGRIISRPPFRHHQPGDVAASLPAQQSRTMPAWQMWHRPWAHKVADSQISSTIWPFVEDRCAPVLFACAHSREVAVPRPAKTTRTNTRLADVVGAPDRSGLLARLELFRPSALVSGLAFGSGRRHHAGPFCVPIRRATLPPPDLRGPC